MTSFCLEVLTFKNQAGTFIPSLVTRLLHSVDAVQPTWSANGQGDNGMQESECLEVPGM